LLVCSPGTVLLHLFAAALIQRSSLSSTSDTDAGAKHTQDQDINTIHALYIPVPSPFHAMEAFIDDSAARYRLSVFHCPPPAAPPGTESLPLPVESVSKGPTPATSAVKVPTLSSLSSMAQTALNMLSPSPQNSSGPVGKARGGEGMRQALELYKAAHPHINAILVGTRRGDPHGGTYSAIGHVIVDDASSDI
jgi:FAD synthetase